MKCRRLGSLDDFISSISGNCITFAYQHDFSLITDRGASKDLLSNSLLAYTACLVDSKYVLYITRRNEVFKCVGVDELFDRLFFRDKDSLLMKRVDSALPLRKLIEEVG